MLYNKPAEVWHIHPDITAIRLVTIITLLRVFLNFEGKKNYYYLLYYLLNNLKVTRLLLVQ